MMEDKFISILAELTSSLEKLEKTLPYKFPADHKHWADEKFGNAKNHLLYAMRNFISSMDNIDNCRNILNSIEYESAKILLKETIDLKIVPEQK
jgi:hypothetical protein